jgi:hypothetical protein
MSQQNIIAIMDAFWEQVAGNYEYTHTQWSMSTYVKVQSFTNGKISGLGLWGSKPLPFTIDFGSNFDQLEFDCDCQSFKNASKNGNTAPCPHIIRGLLEIESKLKQQDFETTHCDRLNTIIPF